MAKYTSIRKEQVNLFASMHSDEAKNFCHYMREITRYHKKKKTVQTMRLMYEYAADICPTYGEMEALCETIFNDFAEIAKWYALDYIASEYEETELDDSELNAIWYSLGYSSLFGREDEEVFTPMHDIASLEQCVTYAMDYLI